MKSLSVLLVGGLLWGSAAELAFACGSDSGAPDTDSLKTLGEVAADDDAVTELEDELKAEGNKRVQIELLEEALASLSHPYEAESDNNEEKPADGDTKPTERPRSRVSGKVVIIDANGKRREFQFNGDQARVLQNLQKPSTDNAGGADDANEKDGNKPDDLQESDTEERFVLGVQCEEASELLRSHLKLGNKGLVILEVREATPAAEAGLQQDDIIVSIDNNDLENLPQLVEAVSKSDGAKVKLSVLRAGDSLEISVTPRKMQVPTMVVPAGMEVEEIHSLLGHDAAKAGVRRIHAGVLLDGQVPGEQKDVQELIERLREMAENSENSADVRSQISITTPRPGQVLELKASGETEVAVKELQKQVRQLQQQLSELQKKVQPAEPETQTESAPETEKP